MSRRWLAAWSLAMVVGLAVGLVSLQAADSPETVEKMIHKRRIKQLQNSERYRMTPNIHWGYLADGGGPNPNVDLNSSIVNDNGYAVNPVFRTYGAPPPDPLNSIPISITFYEHQHNSAQGYQTGRLAGNDIVHFIWTYWDHLPLPGLDPDRLVNYGSYTISGMYLIQGYGGVEVSQGIWARGGYCGGEVDDDNCFHGAFHQRAFAGSPYTQWHLYFPTPGSAMHIDDELLSATVFGELMWPRVTIAKKAGAPDVYHFIAHGSTDDTRNRLLYWRFDPDSVKWFGPVAMDSTTGLYYTLAADPNSQKVAVTLGTSREFTSGNNNVAYYESHSDGKGWINQTELGTPNKNFITNYNSSTGPQFWGHTSTRYDHSGYLHIVWDEQRVANTSFDIKICHWSDSVFQIRPVALGYWDNEASTGGWNLHLAKVTMGIGSGGTLCQSGAQSNKNYVYVVYTQFGGSDAVSNADYSKGGYYNGELYLSVSNSGGRTWAPPMNITNTKTPGCNPGATPTGGTVPPRPDSVCRSEHWATIGPEVNDVDVIFTEDNDAGGIPQGEGTWQINRMMYLRFPGSTMNAQYVCPVIAANYAAFLTAIPECEYHAKRGATNLETFTLINLGNAAMNDNGGGGVTVSQINGPAGWLTMTGTGPYIIAAGDPDKVETVTMSAVGITIQGLYQGSISVTHNAPNVASPQVYPIDFFVVDDFFCPQDENMKTGVTVVTKGSAAGRPGSLALDVRSNSRFGSQDDEGGLYRYFDSSNTVFDASLLIAHDAQAVGDTVVFHRFFDRNDPGQYGYRALGNLVIDTARYTTGSGFARACAQMTTADSAIGVVMEWYFSQNPDSDEFVVARYGLYNMGSVAVNNLVVGVLMDLDVVPATRYGSVQSGVRNQNGQDWPNGLVWQQGTDTVGHVPSPAQYTAERYRGGIRYIGGSSATALGAQVGNNVQDIQPGGGPKSEWLYRTLVSLAGANTPALPDTDMYTIMAIAKGVRLPKKDTTLAPVSYSYALISDTLDQSSFNTAAARAKAFGVALWKLERHADPDYNGVTNVNDVVMAVGVAFRGVAKVIDPCCPYARTDVDCNSVTDVNDVVRIVNVAFRNGTRAANFCRLCGAVPVT